jgi:4-alpha-glucanotransferase
MLLAATVVAGVPPDCFNRTGQRWGILYRWEVMGASGYVWWIQRLRTMREMVDIIRLDHFRGFEAYWECQPPKIRRSMAVGSKAQEPPSSGSA